MYRKDYSGINLGRFGDNFKRLNIFRTEYSRAIEEFRAGRAAISPCLSGSRIDTSIAYSNPSETESLSKKILWKNQLEISLGHWIVLPGMCTFDSVFRDPRESHRS